MKKKLLNNLCNAQLYITLNSKTTHMIKDLQQTIIDDTRDSVRKMLDTTIAFPEHKQEMIDIALETIEITILNAFWKHGIAGTIKTDKGQNI